MNIRFRSELEALFANTHPIREESPEVLFIRAVCRGDENAVLALFAEEKLFGHVPPVIDTPYARFEGLDGIRAFVRDWHPRFHANASFAVPCIQTIANGRVALEVSINFTVDGAINQVPMYVIADFRTPTMLDEVRIYCYYAMVPGLTPYRKPMFTPAHLEMGDPGLLTGAVREYYEALHHQPAVDVDKILNAMGDTVTMGGYQYMKPDRTPADYRVPKEKVRGGFTYMQAYIPSGIIMRYETLIDDGKTCVIEWVHIVSKHGQENYNRISLSCIAAYERGDDGKLCSVRIMDYAGREKEIDWTKTPISYEEARALNYIEYMVPGCGAKKQYDM